MRDFLNSGTPSEKGRYHSRFVSVKDIREQAGRIRHLESRIDAHEEANGVIGVSSVPN